MIDARLWHPRLRVQHLLRDIAGGSAWEVDAVAGGQRAAWAALREAA